MEPLQNDRAWTARWIGAGFLHNESGAPSRPAPFFRRPFFLSGRGKKAEVFFCGLGWSELYLNGEKVGDAVLSPSVTQYDRRARYLRYDVTKLLRRGENVFGALLGNGWYDCSTGEVWHFDKAPWQDYPKLLFELVIDGRTVLVSDDSWQCLRSEGPVRFNELRNGENYDARREIPGWAAPGFRESAQWTSARVVPGPGGVMTEQTMPPCKVMKRLAAAACFPSVSGGRIYDLGQNITGWARIRVKGEAGAKITLAYAERISAYKDQILPEKIASFVRTGAFQTDSYILSGNGIEEWEPRFTYHGFRYVEVRVDGDAELLELQGCLVHTAFEALTEFESSDPVLNRLHACTLWSFVDNFTGIPTDCPHREKNGWTGDALMAAETGLFHFSMASSYHDWLQTMADAQRPNGQLPGIVPTAGWGFNWGSGPAWDSAFLLIPWYVYLYTGETRIIEENYEPMRRYVDFCGTMAKNHILDFGLGDWCHPDISRMADVRITSTGYYYADVMAMARYAKLLGCPRDEAAFRKLGSGIAAAFNAAFYNGGGSYGKDEMTSLGCALYQGLCPASETAKTAERLDALVRENRCRADFGILGAKYVPRALAEHGYPETAYRLITQPAFPGWADWINHGATTLWETWSGDSSQNHIMFGDIAAWMIQYLGGIVPDEDHPGFSELKIRPFAPQELSRLHVRRKIPGGELDVAWTRKRGDFQLTVSIPAGIPCHVRLPDGSVHRQTVARRHYRCKLG